MTPKILKRATISDSAMIALLSIFLALPALVFAKWFLGTRGLIIPASEMALMWAGAMAINHALLSPFSETGLWAAVGESLGFTFAFSILFWPLSVITILLTWLGFGVVSYYSGFLRIRRLKKKGYAEFSTEG